MKKARYMVWMLAAALMVTPMAGYALTLDESTCTYQTDPEGANEGTHAGFVEAGGQLMTLLLGIINAQIEGGIGFPVPETWDDFDLEQMPDETYGDGLPDSFQMALLAAVLCTDEVNSYYTLIKQQYATNLDYFGDLIDQVDYVINSLPLAIALLKGGEVEGTTYTGIGTGLLAIGEPFISTEITLGDDTITIGELAQDLVDLGDDIEEYSSIVGAVSPMLQLLSEWFAGMGGLNSEMKSLITGLLGQVTELLADFEDYKTGFLGLVEYFGPEASGPIPQSVVDEIDMLIGIIDAFTLTVPDFEIYGVTNSKTADEPFSALGDFDGDGVTNLDAYNALAPGEGYAEFVASAGANVQADELPVAGLIGLGLLASALAAGATSRLRKRS